MRILNDLLSSSEIAAIFPEILSDVMRGLDFLILEVGSKMISVANLYQRIVELAAEAMAKEVERQCLVHYPWTRPELALKQDKVRFSVQDILSKNPIAQGPVPRHPLEEIRLAAQIWGTWHIHRMAAQEIGDLSFTEALGDITMEMIQEVFSPDLPAQPNRARWV